MKSLRTALSLMIVMTILLGLVYPAFVWLTGQVLFYYEAHGSLIYKNGKLVGSNLIGQNFTSVKYFWPRPSATSGSPYQFLGSGASNLNPSHPQLLQQIKQRADRLHQSSAQKTLIPIDLLTTSGSGLDPHISPTAALYQVPRIANERGLPPSVVDFLIQSNTEDRTFGFLGQPRVNVLSLNIALDSLRGGAR